MALDLFNDAIVLTLHVYVCIGKRKVELIGQKKLAFYGTLTDFWDVQQAFDLELFSSVN